MIPPANKRKNSFTIVEVVIAIGLMSTIMYLFAMTFESISTLLMNSFARGVISNRLSPTVAQLESDVLDTRESHLAITTSNLPPGQSAIVMSSPRDLSDVYHASAVGAPVWKKVIVYCPYVNDAGVCQLRRYEYESTPETFPFAFASVNPITATTINLVTATDTPFVIDRVSGNPALGKGKKYQAFAPGCSIFQISAGPPVNITVRINYITRRNATIAGQESFDVIPRN